MKKPRWFYEPEEGQSGCGAAWVLRAENGETPLGSELDRWKDLGNKALLVAEVQP